MYKIINNLLKTFSEMLTNQRSRNHIYIGFIFEVHSCKAKDRRCGYPI